jgi:hypothetical protein
MTDEPNGPANASASLPVERAQIISQTVLGIVGVVGYMTLIALVILHSSPWTPFQENQISAAIGFLAGTIVAGIYNYAFGSSFGSALKDAQRRREDRP